MKLITRADETETLARSLEGNEGVYLVSAFTGLGAPHWLPTPGASIVGLRLSSTPAHIARAVLEGVCYQTREVSFCMREDCQSDLSMLRVDGGMAVNRWFLQFLADQCQLQVQKPKAYEQVAEQFPNIKFVKVNIEVEQELADFFEIRSIPHLMVFKEGIVIYSNAGSMPASTLKELVEQASVVDVSAIRAELQQQDKE